MHIELMGPEAAGKTTFATELCQHFPDLFMDQSTAWDLAKSRNKEQTELSEYDFLIAEKIKYWNNRINFNDNIEEARHAVDNIRWYKRLILNHAVISKNINDYSVVWDEGIIHNGYIDEILDSDILEKYLEHHRFFLVYFDVDIDENYYYRCRRRASGYMTTLDTFVTDEKLYSDVVNQKKRQDNKFNILKGAIPSIVINKPYLKERKKIFELITSQIN